MKQNEVYDMLIIGGGPAGVTAALYGARAGLSVLLLEKMITGGEIVSTERLDNYPGFPEGITGAEFGELLAGHLKSLSVPVRFEAVEEVSLRGEQKKVFTNGEEYPAQNVVIATGTVPNLLNVSGELELRGKGVSYCATCDAAFFRGKEVAVVGGGDAALEEALFLARFAKKIYVIHRRDSFRAVKVLQDRLFDLPNVQVLWNSTVQKMEGEKRLTGLRILHDGKELLLSVDGVFVYVGRVPNTAFLQNQLDLDERGFICTNEKMETSLPGVYAAGDVRRKELRQVVTAAADGAIAATMIARSVYGLA
jgi:thioredoxin reductase (NADPH)